MSNTNSVANFYVDSDGKERPIVYQAVDLVNKPAPEGYHWEVNPRTYIFSENPFNYGYWDSIEGYIAVKNKS